MCSRRLRDLLIAIHSDVGLPGGVQNNIPCGSQDSKANDISNALAPTDILSRGWDGQEHAIVTSSVLTDQLSTFPLWKVVNSLAKGISGCLSGEEGCAFATVEKFQTRTKTADTTRGTKGRSEDIRPYPESRMIYIYYRRDIQEQDNHRLDFCLLELRHFTCRERHIIGCMDSMFKWTETHNFRMQVVAHGKNSS